MNMDVIGDDDNRAKVPDDVMEMDLTNKDNDEDVPVAKIDKVEEARQAAVDCLGDRMFSDIGMNDEYWGLQDAYNTALVNSES